MTAAAQGSADAVALITAMCAYGKQTYGELLGEVLADPERAAACVDWFAGWVHSALHLRAFQAGIPIESVLEAMGRLNTVGPA